MVAFNKNCHILAFSLVFCLFLHDATSITVGQVVIQIKNQNSQNLCGLHSSADFIFFFSQKLRITFECGLNSSAGCFRVNWVFEFWRAKINKTYVSLWSTHSWLSHALVIWYIHNRRLRSHTLLHH